MPSARCRLPTLLLPWVIEPGYVEMETPLPGHLVNVEAVEVQAATPWGGPPEHLTVGWEVLPTEGGRAGALTLRLMIRYGGDVSICLFGAYVTGQLSAYDD